MELRHLSREEMRRRSDAVLKDMGLFNYRAKYPKDLSGGMRQRISFCPYAAHRLRSLCFRRTLFSAGFLTRMAMQEWLLAQWEHFHKNNPLHYPRCRGSHLSIKKYFVVTSVRSKALKLSRFRQFIPAAGKF